jgi:hypothetical protein
LELVGGDAGEALRECPTLLDRDLLAISIEAELT